MLQILKKYLLILFGSLSLVIGIIGAFLPVLPTTPFLLISAYCYLRSSKRLYDWLIHHKILGVYIYNYLTYRSIPKRTKVGALFLLWFSLILSMFLISSMHVRIFLPFVGVGVSIHLLTLKTLHLEEPKVDEENI